MLYCSERWPRGLKRRIANPLYDPFVPRVRIPPSPQKGIDLVRGLTPIEIRYQNQVILYVRGCVRDRLTRIQRQKGKRKR